MGPTEVYALRRGSAAGGAPASMANTTGSVDAAGSLGAKEAGAAAAGQCKEAMPCHDRTAHQSLWSALYSVHSATVFWVIQRATSKRKLTALEDRPCSACLRVL